MRGSRGEIESREREGDYIREKHRAGMAVVPLAFEAVKS